MKTFFKWLFVALIPVAYFVYLICNKKWGDKDFFVAINYRTCLGICAVVHFVFILITAIILDVIGVI